MIISGISGVSKSPSVRKKEVKSKESSFLEETKEKEETDSVTGASASTPTNPLFSLQEVDGDEGGNAQAVGYGYDILEQLEAIRFGLLNGSLPLATIQQLEHSIKRWRRIYEDPQLKNIIDEIELRAKVELAKLKNYP